MFCCISPTALAQQLALTSHHMLDETCVVRCSPQGLDPASRRNLWDVIKRQRAGRGIILTTHNMEEAEVHFDCRIQIS